MKARIRELRPGDMESFAELCASRDTLDRESAQKRAEVVEWIAFHNPCQDGNPTYFVATLGDRIVAHLGRMPTHFAIQGQLETGSYFHDLYVHPELRQEKAAGFFLAMKLYRHCERASKSFSAMVWTNPINISLQQVRKYEQMWTDRRVMLLGITSKIDSRLHGPPARALRASVRTMFGAANWANGLRLPRAARVEAIERFDSRFDDLAERTASCLGVAPHKGHRYLNWKYIDRPHLDLRCFQLLDEGGRLTGFCVVVHPDRSRTAAIAELVVENNQRTGMHTLLGRAIGHLQKQGADRIEAVASAPDYGQALQERFFRRDLRIPLFLAKPDASPYASRLRSPRRWHVSLGDSEGPF